MVHVKQYASRLAAWRRLAGFSCLIAVLLLFGQPAGTTAERPAAPANALQDDDELLSGEDIFRVLAMEGVEQSATPPDPGQSGTKTPIPAVPAKKTALPARVDNSKSKYFPPIMAQKGGSCAQASGIHYNFTYEINLARDLDSKSAKNQYPDHWTWNCLNDANGKGSNYGRGWMILQEVGIPTLDVYGDKFSLHNGAGWPSGYDKYYAAMKNRVESHGSFPVRTLEDLEKVKSYLLNHNDPKLTHGGLLSFSCLFKGRKTSKIPAGSPEAGKTIITAWGDGGGHAMTYVGYDDNIAMDVNKDGKITNDIDLNGDGKVDLADLERGAFYFANSHGTKFGDKGFGYIPYRLNGLPKDKGGMNPSASWVKVKKEYQPRTTMLLRFKFEDRSALELSVGYAASPDFRKPGKTFAPGIYNGNFKVGTVPMRGKGNNEPIEIGIDLTDLATDSAVGKFFVNLGRKSGSKANGELQAATIYRYDEQGKVLATRNFTITDGKWGEKPLEVSLAMNPQQKKK